MLRRCFFLGTLFFFGTALRELPAQSYIDIINLSGQFSLSHSDDSLQDYTHLQEFSGTLRIPVKLKNGDVLLPGISASRILIEPEQRGLTELLSVLIQAGYKRNWNNRWATTFIALPRMASSWHDAGKKDWQMGGLVLAENKTGERLKLRFGAYYNREFFGNFFVPLLGLDWRPDSLWQVFGNLPLNATVLCKPRPRLHFGLQFVGIMTSYFLNERNHYLHRNTNDLGLYADIYAGKNFVIQPRAGYAIGRRYREFDEDDRLDFAISLLKFGEDRKQLNTDIVDSPFFQLNLVYRVPVD